MNRENVNLLKKNLVGYSWKSYAALILFQDVMVSYIHENDQGLALIVPDDADIHVDAAFEQTIRPLYPLCP